MDTTDKNLDIFRDRDAVLQYIASLNDAQVKFLNDYTTKTHTDLTALHARTLKYKQKLAEMGKPSAKAINFANDIWRINKMIAKCAGKINVPLVYDFPECKEQQDIVTRVTMENLTLCEESMEQSLNVLAQLFILYSAEDCKRATPYECWFKDDTGATNYESKVAGDDGVNY